jgi:predicted Zn-dependent protease with MMP-like domain
MGATVGARVAPGRDNDDVPIDMESEQFDLLVDQALDGIPDELARLVRNVVVLVEDEPPEDEPDDLLGLYDGVALTERDSTIAMQMPDRIFIFRGPLLDFCDTEAQLIEEVRITVVHEIAHHFGIDDRRLHELGYA